MILYHVQGHTGYDDFKAVCDRFADNGNKFVFTLDGKAKISAEELERLKTLNPIAINKTYPITWVSISQINSMLDAIRVALQDPDWQYYVNISTTDVPLKTQSEIKAFLDDGASRQQMGYVYLHKTIAFKPTCWEGADIEMVDRSVRSDTKIMVSKQIENRFSGWGESPLLSVDTRPSYHCSEVGELRTLYTRPLFDTEARARRVFFEKYPYRIGRIWICLHRNICQQLVDSDETAYVHEMLKTTFVPDEAFFQTLLFANSSVWAPHIVPFNMHHRLGEPIDITDEHLSELQESQSFFARKFVPQNAPAVGAWIETLKG